LANYRLPRYENQGRQGTYNVTLSRIRTSIVAVEKQYLLHILTVSSSIQRAVRIRHIVM